MNYNINNQKIKVFNKLQNYILMIHLTMFGSQKILKENVIRE